MSKKSTKSEPKEESTIESTATSEATSIEICKDCLYEPCKCPKFVCPFHGLVKAKESGDLYCCEREGCEITRKKNDIEYP